MKQFTIILALGVVLTSCDVSHDAGQPDQLEKLDLLTAFQLTDIHKDLIDQGYKVNYSDVVYEDPDFIDGVKIVAISAANANGGRVVIGIADRLEYAPYMNEDVNAYITPAQVFLIEENPNDPTIEESPELAGGRTLTRYNPMYIYPYRQPWLAKYSIRQVTYKKIRISPAVTSNSSVLSWFRRCAYCVGKAVEKACKDPISCTDAAHSVVYYAASCIWRGCPMDGYVYHNNPYGGGGIP